MRNFDIQKIVLIIVLVNIFSACAGKNAPITPTIYSYIDRGGRLEFKDIESLPPGKWHLSETASPSFGIINASIWLKIKIPESKTGQLTEYLEVGYPHLDHVDLYYYNQDQKVIQESTGDSFPFSKRMVAANTFVFTFSEEGPLVANKNVFLRVKSRGPILIPITISSKNKFIEYVQLKSTLHGTYFGFLILIALYNLLLFASIRDQTFIWYSMYIFLALLSTFVLEGYGSQYLSPDYPWWNNRSFGILGLLMYPFALEFTRRYLLLKEKYTKINLIFSILQIIFIAVLIFSFFGSYSSVSKISNLLVFPTVFFIFFTVIKATMDGSRTARFFLLAWSFFLTGQMVLMLRFLGIAPDNIFTKYYVYIGSALEVLLLSLGLGDRFNQQKEDSLNQQIQLTNSYARFVPEQFLTFLNKQSITDVTLGDSVAREMTVLFSDIRSFTSLSESMTPRENFNFINAILKSIGPVIRKHNGFIDKYIGDAVMALFPDSPDDAIKASIEIQELLAKYNLRRQSQNRPSIKIGIGIHTGNLMLGTIGEQERMEGTVIGDTVNLASRLEGLSKYYGVTTIISENVMLRLLDQDVYNFRTIDYVKVKGKRDTVSVIEIIDSHPPEELQFKLATRDKFERAMKSYQKRDFEAALILFTEVLNINPADSVASLYADRIETFQKHGLPPDWDGVQVMDNK